MELHNLKPAKGSIKSSKRVGRGEGSKRGGTSTRGHKGQKSRSGGGVRPGFEGGQMPLHRRLPKKGFSNVQFRDKIAIVNLSQLNEKFEEGATVNEKSLRETGLVKGRCDAIKVLGHGDLDRKLTVVVDAASASARSKIETAGGSVETGV